MAAIWRNAADIIPGLMLLVNDNIELDEEKQTEVVSRMLDIIEKIPKDIHEARLEVIQDLARRINSFKK